MFISHKNFFFVVFLFVFLFNSIVAASYLPASINLIDNIALQTQKVEGVKFDKNYFINVIDAAKFFNLNYIWEPFTNTIEITDNNINLKMRLNSDFILVNNKIQISKNKLILNNGAIYLPIEFLIYLKNNIISISGNNVYYKKNALYKSDDIAEAILKSGKIKLPEIQTQQRLKNYQIKTIIIVPGHGGGDIGAVGYSKKTFEKDITLAVSLKLKNILEKILPNVKILLTRTTDELLYLEERSQFANKNRGDLFVSIHCNAGPLNVRGFETFYFSLTEDDETERTVRLLENNEKYQYRKDKKNINVLDFITTDLAQINHINESIELANLVQARLSEQIQSANRGARKARFFVLKDTFMPAVLIELGFLTNELEEKLLTNDAYQNKLAEAIANAISDFKKKMELIKYSAFSN